MGFVDANFFSAKKYFGQAEPIGKQIMAGQLPLEVTGVMEEMPDNPHFHLRWCC